MRLVSPWGMRTVACAILLLSFSAFARSKDSWVVVRDENSVSMSGSTHDLERARSLLRDLGPGYLWFRHDGKEYVVRDGEKLKEINDLADRQSELGAEQGRLGRVQGDLGRQQGQLGREQGAMGREQARKALRDAWRDVLVTRRKRQIDAAIDPVGVRRQAVVDQLRRQQAVRRVAIGGRRLSNDAGRRAHDAKNARSAV